MDKRFLQFNKEACYSLFLTIIYLCSWIITAYFSGDGIGMIGMPLWFELSCLYLPIIFIILCALMIKFFFKKISLDVMDVKDEI
ncbi:MAG: DUF997 family protein [Arsenophonus sp. ET-YP4-MAG3]